MKSNASKWLDGALRDADAASDRIEAAQRRIVRVENLPSDPEGRTLQLTRWKRTRDSYSSPTGSFRIV